MRKQRLFTPGPTPLSPEVQTALGRPIIHHRSPEFGELFRQLRSNLKKIFKTEQEMVVLSCSGTGGMEAAVCNLLDNGERALAVAAGKFGERWLKICSQFGVECGALRKEYGTAASADEIRQALRAQSDTSALLIQACETSTATMHDMRSIGEMMREDFPRVQIVVDGISAVGCQPIETDAWGLDIVVGGSQKSFVLPPGLAFVSLSKRALEKMRANSRGRFYFDLAREADSQREGKTSYTASVSLASAALASTNSILEQGPDRVVNEAARMARSTRAALRALGFRLLSSSPSNAVTAAYPPEGISAPALAEHLLRNHGVKLAGGQDDLKGRIIRVAHLGYFDLLDVFAVVGAIELALAEMGHKIEPGTGLSAAMRRAL